MAGRKRSGTISVDVDVEVYEVLEQLSDDDLLDEVSSRKLSISGVGASFDLLTEVHWHLLHAGVQSALAMLEGAIEAQRVTDDRRQAQFQAARAAQ